MLTASPLGINTLFLQIMNFLLFPDVNECLGSTHGCRHICRNNVGSFTCSCRAGYTLDTDRKQCNGRTVI